jgi:hypothetical protein
VTVRIAKSLNPELIGMHQSDIRARQLGEDQVFRLMQALASGGFLDPIS